MSIFEEDAAERLPQKFGLGLHHLDGLVPAAVSGAAGPGVLADLGDRLCDRSDELYDAGPTRGAALDGNRLTFDSPLPSEDPEVGMASARLFQAPRDRGRVVVVIPQWNADAGSMVPACRILNRFGLSALRLTLPYHEERRPPGMQRADAMVSPVLGLTLQAVRRAVLEARQAVGWLRAQGYPHVGLLGTSLGSCVGFLALSHDESIEAAAFNHVAGDFADVVWSGLATRHVRESLEGHVDIETLRRCWAPISPVHFAHRLTVTRPSMLLISGAYDPIFLPQHSRTLVDALRRADVGFQRAVLPCGHYTLGRPPFYLIDAFLVVRFFRRRLGRGRSSA